MIPEEENQNSHFRNTQLTLRYRKSSDTNTEPWNWKQTLYLPKKADHSTFARNYDKITEEFLELLLSSFVNRDFSYWIADSTCMSTKIRTKTTF